ncbi:MAG: LPS-assembly protein LptD [Treponema sp.]|nr:LPS-assembly protein LptD [Treponema sp.]
MNISVRIAVLLFIVSPLIAQETGSAPLRVQDAEQADQTEIAAGEAAVEEDAEAASPVEASDTGEADETPPPPAKETPLEMDIRTSTLAELAVWCKTLGLSEGGSKEELANRLRDYYKLPRPDGSPAADEKNRTIVIEAARSAEYFTLEVVDEDYARLKGNVTVSLKDGEAVHRISAGEILYNRTRNWLSASGGVFYEKKEGDSTETFRGDSIVVDLDNWETILTNGQSQRAVSNADTAYRFEGTVISVDTEESTVLTNAKVSNAKTEEPYWSLNASKMWLLPGSDWAVANVVLRVGEIPLLWLPFFYLPSEEIVFHPVVGVRTREGSFFQTTTYLLGRPKVENSTETSFTNMFGGGSDTEKERKGLFLRSTGKKAVSKNEMRLSLLFDVYANLGAYVGTEMSTPSKGIFGPLELSAGMGFTRNIYSGNTPYQNGEDSWNTDNRIFSIPVPFRYRLKTNSSLSGKYGSFRWNLPFYSDPFVDQDFMDRSETLDWLELLKGASAAEDTTTTDRTLSSYSWTLNSSISPKMPAALYPYIASFSISSLNSTLTFGRKQSAKITDGVSPNRMFFYPDKWTMYAISSALSGTVLSLGGTRQASQDRQPSQTAAQETEADYLESAGVPIPPWETPNQQDATRETLPTAELVPPVLRQTFTLPVSGRTSFTIDYRLNPTAASELQFAQTQWVEVEDINLEDRASILSTARGDGSVGFTLAQTGGLYTTSLRFSGTGAWQDYLFLNEEIPAYDTESERDAAYRRAYQQTQFSTSYEYSAALKPFYTSPIWGATSFQYSLKGLMLKNEFDAQSTIADPEWKLTYGAWEKEKIDSQQFSANVNASIMDKVQNVTLTADMPPKDMTITGNATVRFWLSETNVRGKIFNPFVYEPLGLEDNRKEDSLLPDKRKRTFDPLYFTQAVRYAAQKDTFWGGKSGATYSAQQYAVYDPELAEWTNLTSTLTLGGFSATFTMLRSKKYLLETSGWIQSQDTETLNPNSFALRYAKNFSQTSVWDNRLNFSFNMNSSLSLDLQRYTYSKFTFSLGFRLNIAQFMELNLSVNSENNVIYRYIQDIPMFSTGVELPGEKNVFIDLLNSFRFDDESLRKASGFKLKSFNLSVVHHLGDWDASLTMTLSPYLDTRSMPYVYRFNNKITFLVKWTPISELKTEIYRETDQTTGQGKIIFK